MINERKTWKKNCTLFESQCISTKVLVGTLFFTPSTGEPFSGQSQYLHCSVTLSPEYWSGPGNQTHDLPLFNQALYQLS